MQNLVLSTSKINTASICPRLFFFSEVLELEPLSKPDYLESGDLFHRMLEEHYNTKIQGNKPDKNAIINTARNAAAKELELNSEEVESTIKLYSEYHDHYQYEIWKPIAAEEKFIKQLYGDDQVRIFYEGKIDLVVETKDGFAIVDHKKSGRDDTPVDRDNQKISYCWAKEINEFIINFCGTQKSKKIDDRFKRYYFRIEKHHIEDWIESTIDLGFEMLHRIENRQYPARYTGCKKFNRCTFYDVCNSQTELWDWKLKSEFKKKDHKLFDEGVK